MYYKYTCIINTRVEFRRSFDKLSQIKKTNKKIH